MALTPAEKQRRYRERHSNPGVVERALLQEAERAASAASYPTRSALRWQTSWRISRCATFGVRTSLRG